MLANISINELFQFLHIHNSDTKAVLIFKTILSSFSYFLRTFSSWHCHLPHHFFLCVQSLSPAVLKSSALFFRHKRVWSFGDPGILCYNPVPTVNVLCCYPGLSNLSDSFLSVWVMGNDIYLLCFKWMWRAWLE